ncbi:MAG: zf-HC2 domain-containing protein [Betaproteobacteria bacterium]|jgi:hypothetical protein|nr:zf-HC2 domain-containing protein [Betaproteobacteria bacterium]
MLNCHEATRLMSEARDRQLSVSERLHLRLHWGICTGCRRFRRQLEQISVLSRGYVKLNREDNDVSS